MIFVDIHGDLKWIDIWQVNLKNLTRNKLRDLGI